MTPLHPTRLTHQQLNSLIKDNKNLLPIFDTKLQDAKHQLRLHEAEHQETLTSAFNLPDKNEWFGEYMLNNSNNRLKKAKSNISKWHRYIKLATGAYQQDQELDILSAKAVPITSLFAFEKLKQTTHHTSTARCPFHGEQTPSFKIYHEDNHYHCYGCQAHGDSIDFTQRLNNLSFQEAVKQLT